MIKPFAIAAPAVFHFGNGKRSIIPSAIKNFGNKVLLVSGARSFVQSPHGNLLSAQLDANGISVVHFPIDKEPSPQMIDDAVRQFGGNVEVVLAIGGGSVLDAGKAISAMLTTHDSVKNYLEGIGTKNHSGNKLPFIAIPTTSGTGSEATKNAVLSEVGDNGYKKSLRHNNFVPDIAIVDPELTITCPQNITAASGMDAFTQLLESYLSTSANPITDALAVEGLHRVAASLMKVYVDGSDVAARTNMALASYLSGVTLANAGLGAVHGFASALGGYFEISHGVICSSLMSAANKITVRKLRASETNDTALAKYAVVGKMFSELKNKTDDYYIDFLLELISKYAFEMNIASLSHGGVRKEDFTKIITASDSKNNPVALNKDEMHEVLFLSF